MIRPALPHGFTLIELVFSIAIVGILSALALGKTAPVQDQAKMAALAQSTAAIEAGSSANQAALAAGAPDALEVSDAQTCQPATLSRFAPFPQGLSSAGADPLACSDPQANFALCTLSLGPLMATARVSCARSAQNTPETWTHCADEHQTCAVPGVREVRYGARGSYNSRIVSGSIDCSNDVFGDPIGGVAKECLYSSKPR